MTKQIKKTYQNKLNTMTIFLFSFLSLRKDILKFWFIDFPSYNQ